MNDIALKLKIAELRENLGMPYTDQELSIEERIHKIRGHIEYAHRYRSEPSISHKLFGPR